LYGHRKNLETWVHGVTCSYIQINIEISELHLEDFIALLQLEVVLDLKEDIMKLFNMYLIKPSLIYN
jgi:hypothetical protein